MQFQDHIDVFETPDVVPAPSSMLLIMKTLYDPSAISTESFLVLMVPSVCSAKERNLHKTVCNAGQSELVRSDSLRHGRNRRNTLASQEGYGTGAVLAERGIYLTSVVYRPVLQVLIYDMVATHTWSQSDFLLNKIGLCASCVHKVLSSSFTSYLGGFETSHYLSLRRGLSLPVFSSIMCEI